LWLTTLSAKNILIELVRLYLHYYFSYCSFKIKSSHKLFVVNFCKLLFAQLNTYNRLQLVLNLCFFKHNITINHTELHSVQLFNAKCLRF
jgi:hypothetical protein